MEKYTSESAEQIWSCRSRESGNPAQSNNLISAFSEMTAHRTFFSLIGLPFLFLLAACNNLSLPNAQERGILSTKMINLSAAVDTYFTYTPGAPAESDADVLQKAT